MFQEEKDTGLSVALFSSVVKTPLTKAIVSWDIPCTCERKKNDVIKCNGPFYYQIKVCE